MLEFLRFDPTECRFPLPRVPLLPTLQWRDLTFSRNEITPAEVLTGPGVRHFARGRYAMHTAYRGAGVGPAGALLAPAYHCRTMLDPAIALGADVALYEINPDLTPKLASIKTLVAEARPKIKALVLTHYFGFEQPKTLGLELLDFCRQQCITLVEDCSHAWQIAARRANKQPLQAGHLLIASPYKFFACEDGGTLWGSPAALAADKPVAPGWVEELKALRQTLARSRRGALAPEPRLITELLVEQGVRQGGDVRENSSSPSRMYDRCSENNSNLASSRWIMRHTKLNSAVLRRRQNYCQWVQAVAGLSNGRAIFTDLPPECVPYMFGLYIDHPEQHFYALKRLGLPIWRWDEMGVSDCPVSTDYRTHLLHLPCHQSLTKEQMHWMTNLVAKVLA